MRFAFVLSLVQASELDMDQCYSSQIKHFTHRFSIRSNIYKEPASDVDKATRIIEQVGNL